jgi:hypothetical protein
VVTRSWVWTWMLMAAAKMLGDETSYAAKPAHDKPI